MPDDQFSRGRCSRFQSSVSVFFFSYRNLAFKNIVGDKSVPVSSWICNVKRICRLGKKCRFVSVVVKHKKILCPPLTYEDLELINTYGTFWLSV